MSKNRVNRKQKNSYSKIFTAIGNQQISNNPWTYHQLEESRTDIRKKSAVYFYRSSHLAISSKE